ncbi:MAG: NAD-dependent epimerase/dehydratase family protein [Alphaproteobacteria bacterium]|nr:NAD-dependent epimerase/dehydratase family protein [Alphaproteobacteria bacterium]
MLTHAASPPEAPSRVVVLGARGFIGRHLMAKLAAAKVPVLAPGSAELNLDSPDAGDRLAAQMRPGDALVMLSALTPDKGKDLATTMKNLRMGEQVVAAVVKAKPRHVVYISSDGVFADALALADERSPTAPDSLYGGMHMMRELAFKAVCADRLAILRPTLVYGAEDTHNSYGSNRFRRQAAKDGKIPLFGQGEEMRDHVAVEDVAEVIRLCLWQRSAGVLNVVTGRSYSFMDVAKLVAAQFERKIEIQGQARAPGSAIWHRHYDAGDCLRAFPDFRYRDLAEGLAQTHRQAQALGGA